MYISLEIEDKDIDLIILSLEDSKSRLENLTVDEHKILDDTIDKAIWNLVRIQDALNRQTKEFIEREF